MTRFPVSIREVQFRPRYCLKFCDYILEKWGSFGRSTIPDETTGKAVKRFDIVGAHVWDEFGDRIIGNCACIFRQLSTILDSFLQRLDFHVHLHSRFG